MAPIDESGAERSTAIIVAEDLAKCLRTIDTLSGELESAHRAVHLFARVGEDAATFGPAKYRLKALGRLFDRHIRREILDELEELDRIYGISEEVSW
jgi:nucleotidyltransferase/DNA polymerase involved in DNA repair